MVNPVKTFTPVETGNAVSMLSALYLSPLFCTKEIAVLSNPAQVDASGSQGCTRKDFETTFTATVFKVATYILSAGILPLLAILLNYVVRCNANYHYLPEGLPPQLDPIPMIRQDARTRVPETSALLRRLPPVNQPVANTQQPNWEAQVLQYMNGDIEALQAGLAGLDPTDNFNKNAIEEAIRRKSQAAPKPIPQLPPPPATVKAPSAANQEDRRYVDMLASFVDSEMSNEELLLIKNASEDGVEKRAIDAAIVLRGDLSEPEKADIGEALIVAPPPFQAPRNLPAFDEVMVQSLSDTDLETLRAQLLGAEEPQQIANFMEAVKRRAEFEAPVLPQPMVQIGAGGVPIPPGGAFPPPPANFVVPKPPAEYAGMTAKEMTEAGQKKTAEERHLVLVQIADRKGYFGMTIEDLRVEHANEMAAVDDPTLLNKPGERFAHMDNADAIRMIITQTGMSLEEPVPPPPAIEKTSETDEEEAQPAAVLVVPTAEELRQKRAALIEKAKSGVKSPEEQEDAFTRLKPVADMMQAAASQVAATQLLTAGSKSASALLSSGLVPPPPVETPDSPTTKARKARDAFFGGVKPLGIPKQQQPSTDAAKSSAPSAILPDPLSITDLRKLAEHLVDVGFDEEPHVPPAPLSPSSRLANDLADLDLPPLSPTSQSLANQMFATIPKPVALIPSKEATRLQAVLDALESPKASGGKVLVELPSGLRIEEMPDGEEETEVSSPAVPPKNNLLAELARQRKERQDTVKKP